MSAALSRLLADLRAAVLAVAEDLERYADDNRLAARLRSIVANGGAPTSQEDSRERTGDDLRGEIESYLADLRNQLPRHPPITRGMASQIIRDLRHILDPNATEGRDNYGPDNARLLDTDQIRAASEALRSDRESLSIDRSPWRHVGGGIIVGADPDGPLFVVDRPSVGDHIALVASPDVSEALERLLYRIERFIEVNETIPLGAAFRVADMVYAAIALAETITRPSEGARR